MPLWFLRLPHWTATDDRRPEAGEMRRLKTQCDPASGPAQMFSSPSPSCSFQLPSDFPGYGTKTLRLTQTGAEMCPDGASA